MKPKLTCIWWGEKIKARGTVHDLKQSTTSVKCIGDTVMCIYGCSGTGDFSVNSSPKWRHYVIGSVCLFVCLFVYLVSTVFKIQFFKILCCVRYQ